MTTTMTTDTDLDALEAASLALPTTHDYGKPPPGIFALDEPPYRAIDKRRLAAHRLLARERGQPGVTVHPHSRLAAYSFVKLILPPGRVFTKASRRRLLTILQAAGGWWGCLASCGARQASGVCPHADAVNLAAQLHDMAVDEMVGAEPARRCG